MTSASSVLFLAGPRSARDPSPRASMTWDHAQVPPAVVPLSRIVVRDCAATHRDQITKFPPAHS